MPARIHPDSGLRADIVKCAVGTSTVVNDTSVIIGEGVEHLTCSRCAFQTRRS
jgi:hypothetical protein